MSTSRAAGTSGTLIFNDGTSGWLSDAQLEYAVSFSTARRRLRCRAGSSCSADNEFRLERRDLQVTTITRAHYVGVEGELPFEYWDKEDVTFVDLRSAMRVSPPSTTARIRRCSFSAKRWSSKTCA